MAHKHEWVLVNGPVPEGLQLDHLCRVRRCCNPDHLEAVTPAENVRRGQSTLLTTQQVTEIPAMKSNGLSDAAIARIYRVDRTTISKITNGINWRSVG